MKHIYIQLFCDVLTDSGASLLVGPVCSLFLSEVGICDALTSQGDTLIASAITLVLKTTTNAQVLFCS